MHRSTKTLFALFFSVLLLGGGYGIALAQDAGARDEAPTEEAKTQHRMAPMTEPCPMMHAGAKSEAMMEHCPMMQEATAAAMMEHCPMMQEATSATMMEHCPMMQKATEDGRHPEQDARQQAPRAPAETADDVREVTVTVGAMAYAPKQIELEVGVPVRLTFIRTAEGGCTHQVQSPDLGIERTELPLDEPVTFALTPEKAGTFTFACGMGMMKGLVVVKA